MSHVLLVVRIEIERFTNQPESVYSRFSNCSIKFTASDNFDSSFTSTTLSLLTVSKGGSLAMSFCLGMKCSFKCHDMSCIPSIVYKPFFKKASKE